ncbi:transposase [Corynebacterium glutamicum]|nr:transposase [Corynebacterium glutamicum]
MRPRSSLTEHQREKLVELFEQGLSYRASANRIGVNHSPVKKLHLRWVLHGRLSLVEKPTKQQYSFEVKKEIVERYLAGETAMDLAREFQLSSDQLVKGWAVKWRKGGDEALKPKPKGRPKSPAKPAALTEEDKLRRRVEQLEAENAYLKKLRDLRNQRRG